MSQRDANLLMLRDMLEHMTVCQQQLEWSTDSETLQVLTDSLLRDLESCRRICESLRRRSLYQYAA